MIQIALEINFVEEYPMGTREMNMRALSVIGLAQALGLKVIIIQGEEEIGEGEISKIGPGNTLQTMEMEITRLDPCLEPLVFRHSENTSLMTEGWQRIHTDKITKERSYNAKLPPYKFMAHHQFRSG